jgi:hypothetical protein
MVTTNWLYGVLIDRYSIKSVNHYNGLDFFLPKPNKVLANRPAVDEGVTLLLGGAVAEEELCLPMTKTGTMEDQRTQ